MPGLVVASAAVPTGGSCVGSAGKGGWGVDVTVVVVVEQQQRQQQHQLGEAQRASILAPIAAVQLSHRLSESTVFTGSRDKVSLTGVVDGIASTFQHEENESPSLWASLCDGPKRSLTVDFIASLSLSPVRASLFTTD